MGGAAFLERIQDTWLSQAISQSIWGYPIVGALHVLAMALFAGPLLVSKVSALRELNPALFAAEVRWWKAAGLAVVMLTGALLFISQPLHYVDSTFFRIKMAVLVLIFIDAATSRRSRWVSLALWAAVIVAARGMAFY